jgi:chemotaxis protein CheD
MDLAGAEEEQPQLQLGLSRPMTDTTASGNRQRAYLLPGQLYASAEPCQIKTILGSCVAICLWDKRRGAGGMNHLREGQPTSLRYANEATRLLLEQLHALGCRPPNLRAKVFGGAALFQQRDRYSASLGSQNVEAALALMKSGGIPVVAQETGGAQGRKVLFNTDDGVAWSQRI